MDSPIRMLDHTDEATKDMLENVRKRKKKFDNAKKLHNYTIMATLLAAFIFLNYFYFNIAKYNSSSFFAIFSASVNDLINTILLGITILLYGTMNILKQQREKKEKEYHDLRCEIVDRSKDLWKKEGYWENRHHVFEMMKKNYDINLYHEKK
jgi:predicted membrane protein